MKKLVVFLLCIIIINCFIFHHTYAYSSIPNIKINEFMASNGDTILSDNKESSDWIEIINLEDFPVDIGGFYITDHKAEPLRWQIPEGSPHETTIPPKSKIILWADEEVDISPLHLDFKLSKKGESIVITYKDKVKVIDKIDFDTQLRDVSYGRGPDGSDNWMFFVQATPGKENNTKGFSNIKTVDIYLFYKKFSTLIWSVLLILSLTIFVLLTGYLKLRNRIKQNNNNNFYDKVTGLYNRTFFEEKIKCIDRKEKLPISIVIGDINGLKLINDSFGHDEGDKFLKNAAELIKQNCRKKDLVIRWGGDEFVILLPNTPKEKAKEQCEDIKNSCYNDKNSFMPISIALGYSIKKNENEDLQEIIRQAETMMYNNKLNESKIAHKKIIAYLIERLKNKEKNSRNMIQKLALKVGESLNLSQNQMDNLRLLSIYHDIGKVAVTDNSVEISEKQIDERIKRHPVIGYSIIRSNPNYASVADEILSHHENWDGSGYPNGLKGEEIPLNSRIIFILESYQEHMIKSKKQAVEEIKKQSGKKFDPYIVSIIIKVLED